MKKTRLSYKKVEAIIAEWNAARGLEYRNKGFLMLKNDGTHHFLGQISKEGGTCIDAITTNGSLRDCVDSMWQADNDLLNKEK